MGAGQSSQVASTTPQPTKDISKMELFSVIFMRLLKKTDILDIRAITKGPGACGDYIVLLSKDLQKEFSEIKLETTSDLQATTISDFLFAQSKAIKKTTPGDESACRALATFYMRALQLVAALTLSIYSPPDLVSRIRNRVFQDALKEQQKRAPITLEEKESLRVKRDAWFLRFFGSSSGGTGVYTMIGKPSFTYYKNLQQLVFTDQDDNQYKVKISIQEPDTYKVSDELIKPNSYWILVDTTADKPLWRGLVYPDKKAWVFSATPDTGIEDPVVFAENWTDDLPADLLAGVTPQKPVKNNNTQKNRGVPRWYGGRRTRRMRGGQNIPKPPVPNTSLNLSSSTTLPRAFQDSYRSMVKWSEDISTWTESAPASYREVLLYISPTAPTGAASSYLCVDNWADKKLRYIPPFASLEALYWNRDDGTADQENQVKLSYLVNELNTLYLQHTTVKPNLATKKNTPTSFMDISTPPVNEAIRNLFCAKRTAQGEVLLDPKFAPILLAAQTEIFELYKAHFDKAHELLTRIFLTSVRNSQGETKVTFSDTFTKSSKGARAELEDLIRETRGVIAAHYVAVETRYYGAIQELLNASRA
jgi:hypothetical protein